MNLNRPLVVRALMGAAVVVLVVGLIGVFTVEEGGDAADLTASGRTTTTAAPTPTTEEENPAVGGSDTTLVISNESTTTRPPASTTTISGAAIPDPGPTKPPAAGKYGYKFVYAADPSRNANITVEVKTEPPEGAVQRRKETYPDGQGNNVTYDTSYAADGVRIVAAHILAGKTTVDCNWSPAILFLQLPAAVGKSWKYDSKCTTTANGAQATVRREGDNKITGKAIDIIGNVSVRTWVIEEHAVTTVSSAFFNTTRDAVVTRHWSPEYGLITFEKEVGKTNGESYTTERTLQDVKPA